MKDSNGPVFMVLVPIVLLLIGFCIIVMVTSCTLSFQNISTNGKASDLVDENQSTTPDISPDVTIPY